MGGLLSDQERRLAAVLDHESTEDILRRRRMHEEIIADPYAYPVMRDASEGAIVVIDLVLAKRAADLAAA